MSGGGSQPSCGCNSMNYNYAADLDVITGWYITKIISPRGREITFNYTLENETIIESQRVKNEQYEILVATNDQNGVPQSGGHTYSCSYSLTRARYLSQISYDGLQVDFTMSDREDLLTSDGCINIFAPASVMANKKAKKLDQITVSRSSNSLLSATFQYDYFNDSYIGNTDDKLRTNYLRLKLDGVIIQDKDYSFSYIQENNLPAKDTKDVDHWGFYNGKSNTVRYSGMQTSMIVTLSTPDFADFSPRLWNVWDGLKEFFVETGQWVGNGFNSPNTPSLPLDTEEHLVDVCIAGAEREADFDFGKIGTLEQITYPTGGYDLVEYEGHQVQVRTNMSNVGLEWTQTQEVNQYDAEANGIQNGQPDVDEVEIEINTDWATGCNNNEDVGIFILNKCNDYYGNCYEQLYNSPPPAALQIIDVNTNEIIHSESFSFCNQQGGNIGTCPSSTPVFGCKGCVEGGLNSNTHWFTESYHKINLDTILPKGKYKLKVYGTYPMFSTKVIAKIPKAKDAKGNISIGEYTNYDVGGLRVKKVKTYESSGNLAKETSYKYHTEDDNTLSSGELMSKVVYSNIKTVTAYNLMSSTAVYMQLTSHNVVGVQNSAQGSHIGYSRVEEVQTGFDETDNDEWKIVSNFNNEPNRYLEERGILMPPIQYEISNGQLTEETYWKGTTPILVKKIENIYQKTIWDYVHAYEVSIANYGLNSLVYGFYPYEHHVASYLLKETNEYNYDDAGNAIITGQKIEYNTYDLPTKTEMTNSDGVKHITRTQYPVDFPINSYPVNSTGDPDIDAAKRIVDLINNNQIGVPIEVKYIIEKPNEFEKVIGSSLTTFVKKTTTGNKVFYVPDRTYKLQTTSPLTNFSDATINLSTGKLEWDSRYRLLSTTSFDNHGNFETHQRTSGIPISLKWSYNHTLPVAKIINADANEVYYTSFEEISGGFPKGKTGQKSNIGSHTIDVSELNLNNGDNYTLSYWKSSNGEDWIYKEEVITADGNDIIITPQNANYIDEVRLYPIDALMTTISYDKDSRQISHMTNENNQTTHFDYDNFQRLTHIYDFEGNLISRYKYNYANTGTGVNDMYNYVQSWTFLTDGVDESNYQSQTLEHTKEELAFMDGLGRPIQSIAVGQASDKGDIVSYVEYDEFGLTPKQYLPFVYGTNNTNQGAFVTNAFTQQQSFNATKYGTNNSFATTKYDGSPLNRVVEQGSVGDDWQIGGGHTIQSFISGNTGVNNAIIDRRVYDFENNQYYAANELLVNHVSDENNVSSYSFTDKIGRTILTRRALTEEVVVPNSNPPMTTLQTEFAETYYIYDDFGRIEKVIPPVASKKLPNINWNTSHTDIVDLIYSYAYDERGRMIVKKIPSALEQHFVYDRLDRVILSQDGNQRTNSHQWTFTKYDILGRPIMTGIYDEVNDHDRGYNQYLASSSALLPYENSSSTSGTGYTFTNAFPTSSSDCEIQTLSYYDEYDFDENGTDDVPFNGTHTTVSPFYRLKGLLTGTRVRVLDGNTTPTWLHTVNYYDDRGRIIETHAQNHMGGYDVTANQYDFSGKTLKTIRKHTISGGSDIYVHSEFSYDHAGRVKKVWYGVGGTSAAANDSKVILTASEYDKIGQLVKKKLHSHNNGCSYLQDIDYEYNIRGWLTAINDVEDMSEKGSPQLCQVNTTWTDPHNNANTYYYADEHLMPNHDGVMELTYNEIIRTYCSWRKVNPDGSSSPMMQLVKHTNGSWYVWDENFSTRMSKPSNFVGINDIIRLSREGDDFKVYVNGNHMHTVNVPNSSQFELIPVGILSNGGQTQHAFYHFRAEEAEDLFAMKLDYTTSNTNTGAVAQYNGNISQVSWKTIGDVNKGIYGFDYDDLNRLTNAQYVQQDNNSNYLTTSDYTVSNITYDLNGNILTLDRMGWDDVGHSSIDQLSYVYENNSNILKSVTDATNSSKGFDDDSRQGVDYQYDDNGNMVRDENKDISIEYNHLNLPTKVTFDDGKEIRWLYDAAGVKLTKYTDNGSGGTTEKNYVGGIEYLKNGTTDQVEAIYHSEGRLFAQYDGNNTLVDYQYEYTIKDHLGNARVSFSDLDKSGKVEQSEVLQTNHYYPFGLVHEGNQVPQQGPENAYQYNGKELNSDFGLDWLDYGARWYDASIARWSAVDPLAESMVSWSPFNYAFNNPLRFIDPDGNAPSEAIENDPPSTDGFSKVRLNKTEVRNYILQSVADAAAQHGEIVTEDNLSQKEDTKLDKAVNKISSDEKAWGDDNSLKISIKVGGESYDVTLDLSVNEKTGEVVDVIPYKSEGSDDSKTTLTNETVTESDGTKTTNKSEQVIDTSPEKITTSSEYSDIKNSDVSIKAKAWTSRGKRKDKKQHPPGHSGGKLTNSVVQYYRTGNWKEDAKKTESTKPKKN